MDGSKGGPGAELERLRARVAMLDDMLEGVQILDQDLRYRYVNRAAAIHGRTTPEALLGRTFNECYPGAEGTDLYTHLVECAQARVAHTMENRFTYPDGRQAWFELRIQPISEGVLVLSIDIDDRRRLEEQLRQAQKMEAVGQMAGGIAHDFNNLLTVIMAYTGFVLERLPPDNPYRQDLEQIAEASDRGADLTRQLLALGRRQVTQPRLVRVKDTVKALEGLIDRMVGEDVLVRVERGAGACAVTMDPGHLDQVILNLTSNARDAMPTGGTLTFRVEETTVDAAYADRHLQVEPGPYVVLTVADTGVGMAEEVRERLFEPFYTTKEPGHGTGLGLATSHGIVRQAGGQLWVYSEVGEGSTFKVFLPRTDPEGAPATASPLPEPDGLSGTETILVVDDQPELREVCARALSRYGYTVLQADGVQDALRFAARYSGPIHAVVTDVVMADGRGPDLVEALLPARPDLQFLYMSGYVGPDLLGAIDPIHFVDKPFTAEGLARRLRQVLGAPSPG